MSPDTADMETLACTISKAGTAEAKRRLRGKMQVKWRSKMRPTTPQAEPTGLFGQEQQTLFEQEEFTQ